MARNTSPVVVIGAGPYGLSAAAHLRARGVETRVFGDPMATWREHMPYGMYLKSTPQASSIAAPGAGLTYARYCAEQGRAPSEPLPADDFVEYGMWFQSHAVPHLELARVEHLGQQGAAFGLRLETGEELTAPAVVVASGLLDHTRLAAELVPLVGTELVSHSSQHGDLTKFKEKRVAVIGGGQSALESAVLLAEGGAIVHLVSRRPALLWGGPPVPSRGMMTRGLKPESPLGPGWSLLAVSGGAGLVRYLPNRLRRELGRRILGPSGAWWLRDRFDGEIELHLGRRIAAATPSGAGLSLYLAGDGTQPSESLEVDHVLAATGYEVRIASVPFIEPSLRSRIEQLPGSGSPRLSAGFQSSVRGLFFAGLPALATFGPLLRFVCGTGFASRRITEAIARQR
jgi:hypothetical protein